MMNYCFKFCTLFLTLVLWQPNVNAANLFDYCKFVFLNKLPEPTHDTAVELELATSPHLMKIFTTIDGKVSGILGKDNAPDWFTEEIHREYGKQLDPQTMDWDKLNPQTQIKLIRHISKGRKFHADREVHGLKIKSFVEITVREPMLFLGKIYKKPGNYTIDVSKVFGKTKVEYRGSQDVDNFSGVELHFRPDAKRYKLTSGAVSLEAAKFVKLIGSGKTHQHVHMVAPIPTAILIKNPELEAIKLTDLVRRVNLLAEMEHVIAQNKSLVRVHAHENNTSIDYWDAMKGEDYDGIQYFFQTFGESGYLKKIGNAYKIGLAGIRGNDSYSGQGANETLWGIEYRAVPKELNPLSIKPFLDQIQWSMANHQFGINDEKYLMWMKYQQLKHRTENGIMMAHASYNKESIISSEMPQEVRQIFFDAIDNKISNDNFEATINMYQELKMIFFDWKNDPIVFARPQLIPKILERQKIAILELGSLLQEKPSLQIISARSKEIVSRFLRKSGLYLAAQDSFMVNHK